VKSIGRTAIGGLGVLALAIAVLSFATHGGHAAPATVAAAGITLGVDVTTDGNSASQLGTIDSCRQVNVGDADFDVDVYVTDASGLMGWSVYLTYDPARLSVANFSTSFMEPQFPASYDYGNGLLYLASAQPGGASGSGVLGRITFHAVSNGSSPIHIRTDGPYAPYLNNDQFSGSVSDAQIAIGQGCGVPTAAPTPSPTPLITPSAPPTPSPTPAPTQTPPVTPGPTATPAPTPGQPIAGDADCNGTVGLPDVLTALTYASKLGPGNACQGRTDTDCDGFVTANDVLRILRYLAGDAIPQPTGCVKIGSPASR
jgi:hypothetical protein